jgi:hypothetical protein
MAMAHQLPCFLLGAGEAHPLDNIVKPSLEELKKVVAGNALHPFSFLKVAAELTLEHAIDTPDLLFFPEL